jgi:hypothetical protein
MILYPGSTTDLTLKVIGNYYQSIDHYYCKGPENFEIASNMITSIPYPVMPNIMKGFKIVYNELTRRLFAVCGNPDGNYLMYLGY